MEYQTCRLGADALRQRVNCIAASFDGKLSLSVASADGADVLGLEDERVMPVASMGKLFILGCLLEQCQKGKRSLEERISLKGLTRVGGSGLLQYLNPEAIYPVQDLALMMVIVSDNMATNGILRYLGGADSVKQHLAGQGILNSGVNRPIAGDASQTMGMTFSKASSKETVLYLQQMEQGKILQGKWLEKYHEITGRQQYKNMFLREMPLEEMFDEEEPTALSTGSKTGFDEDVRADAGWIRFPDGRRYVYAVIAGEGRDNRYCYQNAASVCMGQLGRAVYEALV